MATTSPTRVDDELYASAKAVGAVMSRSAAQQLAHWARVGRELEASGSISARDIARVLAGGAYDSLADLDLEAEFLAVGQSRVVELDEGGQVVERQLPAPAGR